jgi:hypothetical protein
MAEFSFFSAQADYGPILKSILSLGRISLIPYKSWPTPQVEYIGKYDERLDQLLKDNRKTFYIWGDEFSIEPPVLSNIKDEVTPKFMVSESQGGPGMMLRLPACFLDSGHYYLNPGKLSHQREYWKFVNGRASHSYSPSPELKAGYLLVKKKIQSMLKPIKIGGKSIRIGPDALNFLLKKNAHININGTWYRREPANSLPIKFIATDRPARLDNIRRNRK